MPVASPAPPRPRSRRRSALLLVASYAGAVTCAAFLFLAWRLHVHHATFASRGFFWLGDLHVEDDEIGFRMRPRRQGMAVLNHGVEAPWRRIPVRTDQFGFRVPLALDSTVVQPGGIAAVGCSCTFGHGVAAESSYVQLAGELLGLPAYNLGVCSYSSVTSLLLLRRNIARLRPGIVVYGYGNFHVERSLAPRNDSVLFQAHAVADGDSCRIAPPRFSNRVSFASAPRIETLYYRERLAGRPTPFDLARLRALLPLALEDLRRAPQPAFLGLRFAAPAVPETTLCRAVLGDMQALCHEHGARFVLLFFPAFFGETPGPGLRSALRELQGRADFTFVDCSVRLCAGVRDQEEYSGRYQVPRDGHPNRAMHLEMARALAAALGGTPPEPRRAP